MATCGRTGSGSATGCPNGSPGRRATAYGIASALTLDEFALWLDLHDDYWDSQGRKSIDAVALFAGLLTIGVAGRDIIDELGLFPRSVSHLVRRDQQRRATRRQSQA